jgi:hypothetical protein
MHSNHETNHNGTFGSALGAFVLATVGGKLMWALLVPTLLAGAVDQGLVANSLSWGTAALFGTVVAVAVFFIRHPRRHGAHTPDGHTGTAHA